MSVKSREEYLAVGKDLENGFLNTFGTAAILKMSAQDTAVDFIQLSKLIDKKGQEIQVTVVNNLGVERTGTGIGKVEATADACSKF